MKAVHHIEGVVVVLGGTDGDLALERFAQLADGKNQRRVGVLLAEVGGLPYGDAGTRRELVTSVWLPQDAQCRLQLLPAHGYGRRLLVLPYGQA